MNLSRLDNPALLQLASAAIAQARDVEAVRLLKTVLERDPGNLHAQYLLAIQHAQLGLYERAEERLRAVLSAQPQFVVARFQLAQLLLMRGTVKDAREWLLPVLEQGAPLGAYAQGLLAAAEGDAARACGLIEAALLLPQPVPVLAGDMRRLCEQLRETVVA
ncbi:tetratricopeptide repeat protein [Lysobacter sp. TAB13]|uniref:tetratricopeptide repeat protein n=1 Tax=Lysobacter sp. TAB13 TaxID=3233065 RepID=UPI003F952E3F